MRELAVQPKQADEVSKPPPRDDHGAAPAVPEEDEASAPVTWLPPDDE